VVFQQVKIRKYELKKSTFYLLKKQNQNPASKISKNTRFNEHILLAEI